MSNAAKHRKKAAEFEQLKQIDRAIAAYVKAIEESEAAGEDVDVALYNKVGDLALRQGRVPDAITYYERAVEHYATSGLFNNAIALCNKILRNAPGRANVYFTLGRISARKGLRGDATRNFLEYATRMQQEGRIEEGIRALAEVLDIMPELNDVRAMVDDLAARSGIALPRRRTPMRTDRQATPTSTPAVREIKSQDLIFLDIDYGAPERRTPIATSAIRTPAAVAAVAPLADLEPTGIDDAAAPPVKSPIAGLPLLDLSERPTLAPVEERVDIAVDVPIEMVDEAPQAVQHVDDAEPLPAPIAEDVPERLPEVAADAAVDLEPTAVAFAPAELDEIPAAGLLEGLEANGDFADPVGTPVLEGFTADEPLTAAEAVESVGVDAALTWIAPNEADPVAAPLDEIQFEDFENATTDPGVARAIHTETPPFTPVVADEPVPDDTTAPAAGLAGDGSTDAASGIVSEAGSDTLDFVLDDVPLLDTPVALDSLEIEPLEVEAVPELEEAIAAGRELVAQAEAVDLDAVEEVLPPTRPPFRLDPHDFILPGELPPLLLSDDVVDVGLTAASAPAQVPEAAERETTSSATPAVDSSSTHVAVEPVDDEVHAPLNVPADVQDVSAESAAGDAGDDLDDVGEGDDERETEGDDEEPTSTRPVSVTPALPIAAVAEAAATVASSRRDSLRAAVARLPKNWLLRRRLAEALFEAGERDAALHELETAQQGLVNDGEFAAACDIADELVHVSPDRVAYHQKRVELAVRSSDQQRLRFAYLDLADALVRLGEEGRARAVYARVLEIDPYDDRARAALGAAAPPPPPPPAAPAPARADDSFVDLADWLRDDDKPADTRMRMREPAISGDEQADFDALLRHFKEGVSRSLGEDDFESHYDLGVAYKEMGLLDDAVTEFQKALRSQRHRLPAYEALGQCFVEQGRFQVAATVLSRALHEPGLDDDKRVGVLYLLGYSCEALQRKDEARGYFQRVYATDINFRDVAARLAAIEQASR